MKKNRVLLIIQNLLLLLTITFSMQAYTQLQFEYEYTDIEPVELVATYTLKYLQDTTNPDFLRNVDMLLFLGQNTSKFISREKYSADTIMKSIANSDQYQEFLMNPNKPFPKVRYGIYKNYPEGMLTFIEHVIGGTYKFEENLDLFNWQLIEDTTTISNYRAQKASCDFGGRSWVAWFSPEVPYSDGPYKFNGLPGLIVKIYDTQKHYVFELISIEKPEKEIMIDMKEKDYIETNKQGFYRAKDAFRDDIISRAKAAGIDRKGQQTAARNMAERNNPIELKRK